MNTKKLMLAMALTGAFSVGQAAEMFTVQEGAIPGTPANEVDANQLTLRYEAFVDQEASGEFVEQGWFDVTGLSTDGSAESAFLNSPEAVGGYQLFGTFTVEGDIAFVGTTALATFDSGDFFLYADPNSDTQMDIVGGVPVCVAGCGDDLLLASSTTVLDGSEANIPLVGEQAASGGSYIINYADLDLTALGEAYFISPIPFYIQLEVTGENESFSPPLVAGAYEGLLVGDASAVFQAVPEPGTLGLLGLALAGVGFFGFRRSKLG